MSNSRIIVADGNNVAYYGVKNNIPRISHLLALIENFKDDKLIIIVSPALKYKIDDKSKLKELIKTKIVLESPPRENDDKYILEITKKLSAAIIISNDCFKEFEISYSDILQKRKGFMFYCSIQEPCIFVFPEINNTNSKVGIEA